MKWLRARLASSRLFWENFLEACGSIRHRWHYAKNQSMRNIDFNPWISSCECCCICKEEY